MQLLLLSYHFPPLNVTASQRALAWARFLPEHGIDVSVVTYDWEGVSDDGSYEVFRLPAETIKTPGELPVVYRIPGIRSLATLWSYLKGRPEYQLKADENRMWDFLCDHLKTHSYDLVLGVFSPHYHIHHAHRIEQTFGIPFVIDFRDLLNNRYLVDNDHITPFSRKVLDNITLRYWKRWMKNAASWTTVSQPLSDVLTSWFRSEGKVIHNGFSPLAERPAPRSFDRFTVMHCGTMYHTQRLDVFLKGFERFIAEFPETDLVFWGSTIHIDKHVKESIAEYAPKVSFQSIPRGPREEAFAAQQGADVLLFPAHYGMKGVYSSKIFEYLASGSEILLTPNDHDVLEELLNQHPGCTVADTPEDVYQGLKSSYERRGQKHQRNIEQWMRSSQAADMAAFLKSIVD